MRFVIALAILASVVTVGLDLRRWKDNSSTIRAIANLRGRRIAEVHVALNSPPLAKRIVAVREYNDPGNSRMVVEFRGVSLIGLLTSVLLPDRVVGGAQISGLVVLYVDDGMVVSYQLVQ